MNFQQTDGRIWLDNEEGRLVAEITFPEVRPGVADIDHTFVDPSRRGQGAAGKLVQAAADQLRQRGMKAQLTCSYAKKWFGEHPEQCDLLAGE
ncbi:GNAT family N-acetyltransferase [Intestinimonas massiliensis (ex Afouda et al. 2020)]|uniref:GNAT family N-acetyltransferase n=1 Tax=Intestinimonas massiliensis (ex Afouda et al. 2020) TaxID=1673721 RepID=UPI00102F6027|nr:GNAT family N-acetyltransferase [Intestinimonas massiliensis (ex Afouda et al. 2020)]